MRKTFIPAVLLMAFCMLFPSVSFAQDAVRANGSDTVVVVLAGDTGLSGQGVPVKDSTSGKKGAFSVMANMSVPVYGADYDNLWFGELSFGYIFPRGRMMLNLDLGWMEHDGMAGGDMINGNIYTGMVSFSYGMFGKGRFSLYPTLGVGVAYGDIDYSRNQVRCAVDLGLTLLYRPFDGIYTGLELNYMGLSNSKSQWLMLGIKIGFALF